MDFMKPSPGSLELHRKLVWLDEMTEREVAEAELASFAKRVRLPGSAFVARLYSRLDAWRAARVERKAQACFERGWV